MRVEELLKSIYKMGNAVAEVPADPVVVVAKDIKLHDQRRS